MTRYHVAGPEYIEGNDLRCWDELEADGIELVWKYEGEPADTDVVCMFETRVEAEAFRADFGGTLLVIELPDNLRDNHLRLVTVCEGYPAIMGRIPAEYVEVVR